MTEIKKNLLQHNLKSFHIIYKDKHKLKSKNNNIKPVQCFCLNQHRSHGPIFLKFLGVSPQDGGVCIKNTPDTLSFELTHMIILTTARSQLNAVRKGYNLIKTVNICLFIFRHIRRVEGVRTGQRRYQVWN